MYQATNGEPRMSEEPTRLLRIPDVCRLTGFSRSSIYRLEGKGSFPASRRIGGTKIWLASEVEEWLRNPKGKNDGSGNLPPTVSEE